MPTYEYACTSCGRHTDVVQAFTDAPLTVCPHCGGELRKVFGSVGIVFKGSGFYKNDSRPKEKSSYSSKDSGSSSSGESTSSDKEKATGAKDAAKVTPKESPKESAKKADPKPASATT